MDYITDLLQVLFLVVCGCESQGCDDGAGGDRKARDGEFFIREDVRGVAVVEGRYVLQVLDGGDDAAHDVHYKEDHCDAKARAHSVLAGKCRNAKAYACDLDEHQKLGSAHEPKVLALDLLAHDGEAACIAEGAQYLEAEQHAHHGKELLHQHGHAAQRQNSQKFNGVTKLFLAQQVTAKDRRKHASAKGVQHCNLRCKIPAHGCHAQPVHAKGLRQKTHLGIKIAHGLQGTLHAGIQKDTPETHSDDHQKPDHKSLKIRF